MCLIVLCLVFVPNFSYAQLKPFGGMVTAMYLCDTGYLLYVNVPLQGVQPFMWFWGELPYAWWVMPHPGQYLLGMAAPATVPCVLGIYTIGAGFPIVYHGESY